jgi:integrase
MKLTQRNIGTITVPPGKSEVIAFDDDIPGFGLRVYAGGSATFIFQYRIGAVQRRMKLGSAKAISVQDARKTASQLHGRVCLGQDPANEKAEARASVAETFGAILRPYLVRKQSELKARSFEECQRHLMVHGKPLHGLQLAAIDKRRVANLLSGLATNSGPNLANSVRSSLSSFFGWAMREGMASENPVVNTNKAVTGGARERVLDDSELRLIWTALAEDAYGDILRLLALTAAGRDEIGALSWGEVNFDKGVIELPASRTKNSRVFAIPLSDPAVAILRARPRLGGSEHVFTSGPNGFKGWSNYKINLDARIGSIAPWRLHDLRRTAATRMAELDVQPHTIEAVLNHVSGHKAGVAGIYNRATYETEKRRALNLWAEALNGIVNGSTKVVPINKGKAS